MHRVPQENMLSGNTITGTQVGHGIQAYLSVRSVIKGNIISAWAPGKSGAYGLILNSLTSAASGALPSGAFIGGDGTIADGNIFSGAGGGSAISINYVSGILLRGNTISGPIINAFSAPAIAAFGLTDSVIDGNTVHDIGSEIGINLSTGGPSTNVKSARVTVSGNVIERVSDLTGMFLQDADSLTVTGNIVRACSTGIELQGVTNSVVQGNIANSNQGAGILLDNDGSSAGSSGNRITGNTCRDDGSGYNLDTGGTWTQAYGIRETGNSNNNLFTGNECDSNGTGQLVTAGAASEAWGNIISGSVTAGPLLTANNLSDVASAATARANLAVSGIVASVAAAGYTMINGTATILSWTAPNDGNIHLVSIFSLMRVISATTGAQVSLTFTDPSNTSKTTTWFSTTRSADAYSADFPQWMHLMVKPNTAVTLAQTSAMTGGAATIWAAFNAS
jgi:parallel beta-helix repeat protein